MKKTVLLVVGFSMISATAGVLAGYQLAVRRLNEEYNEKMEEEIQRTRNYYDLKEKYKTPQEAVEKLIKDDAAKAATDPEEVPDEVLEKIVKKLKYNAVENGVAPEMEYDPRQNVFNGATGEDESFESEIAHRDHSKPYIISNEEFSIGELNYDQLTLTYFEGDGVLVDDKDEPYDINYIGQNNIRFGWRSTDPNVVYVRNENLTADFEILRSTGKYAVEVLGFEDKAGR